MALEKTIDRGVQMAHCSYRSSFRFFAPAAGIPIRTTRMYFRVYGSISKYLHLKCGISIRLDIYPIRKAITIKTLLVLSACCHMHYSRVDRRQMKFYDFFLR